MVQNKPGAAGASAANSFFSKTKADGLTLMQGSSSQISMPMRGSPLVNYDLDKFRFIGHISRAEAVLVVNRKALSRLTDPKAQPLFIGAREGEEAWNGMPIWGREFLGWNIKWILGFQGSSEIDLAFRRGELDLQASQNAFILKPLIQEWAAQAIAQVGIYKGGKFERRPDFPDVPTFVEVLGDKRPTGMAWQAYMAWVGPTMVDKFLVAPPGAPDAIVNTLTDAYTRMSEDAKFDEVVRKTVGFPYDVGVGMETQDVVKQLMATPPEATEYGINLQRKFGIIAK